MLSPPADPARFARPWRDGRPSGDRPVYTGVNGSAPRTVDLIVIGGGINGTGIARDAAGRGIGVLLCEQDDLAAHTSSASTKLIHGGLRYLEHHDFRLVRHALRERAVLLRNAPHIIWPLRFVLPHHAGLRPWWIIRLGLFCYDHLGGRGPLPPCRGIDLLRHPSGSVLQNRYRRAFEYSDCWVQDSRLVVLNARDAQARGADIFTRTTCVSLTPNGAGWTAVLEDGKSGSHVTVEAKAVVNAGGPWVGHVRSLMGSSSRTEHRVRLVKGSHIVVRKLFDHAHPYLFQTADGRVLFAIPFEEDYTLLGTTDVEFEGAPGRTDIAEEEVAYICAAANDYLATPLTPDDVVWSYSGIRPLFDDQAEDASAVTRDYVLHLDRVPAPMLSVYGGKITTYRRLSEQAVDMLAEPLGGTRRPHWTGSAPLPGGDIPGGDVDAFTARCAVRYPWLPERLLGHCIRHYGTDIDAVLAGRNSVADLGEHFGAGLYAAEVAYLVEHEWARTAEDILWRRTRKGLGIPECGVRQLSAFLAADRNDR